MAPPPPVDILFLGCGYPSGHHYATFEWKLVELESTARISIMDATGRVIVTQPVNQLEGQWLWDNRGIPRGLFLYELRDSKGTLKAQGKITLE